MNTDERLDNIENPLSVHADVTWPWMVKNYFFNMARLFYIAIWVLVKVWTKFQFCNLKIKYICNINQYEP